MDIDIVIDARGCVTFSAFPEEMLDIALELSPTDERLRARATQLRRAMRGEHDGKPKGGTDDER